MTENTQTGFEEVNRQGHSLIHGGLVPSGMWYDQFSVFANRFHVIRYKFQGYGKAQA